MSDRPHSLATSPPDQAADGAARRHILSANSKAWDALARHNDPLAQPATDDDFQQPFAELDAAGWLGADVAGLRILCLAAGGGRHGPLYAAAGADVTVVDLSGEMLALDRMVARERGLSLRLVETSMDELTMFAAGEFDVVVHPVSTCYVPDVQPVFAAVARVTRPGGLYISQHKSPASLQASLAPSARGYELSEPYYRSGPLPAAGELSHLREAGTLEFLHRWEQLVGGICRAGFVIEDLLEPLHARPGATPGSFRHRAQFVAPYLRIKARRAASTSTTTIVVQP